MFDKIVANAAREIKRDMKFLKNYHIYAAILVVAVFLVGAVGCCISRGRRRLLDWIWHEQNADNARKWAALVEHYQYATNAEKKAYASMMQRQIRK